MIKKLFFIFLMLSPCGYSFSSPECTQEDITELLADYDDNDAYDDICTTVPKKPVPAWRVTLNSIGTKIFGYYLTAKRTCVKYTKQSIQMTSAYLISLRKRLGI